MVKWTPKSETDLEEIAEHISENFNSNLAVEIIYKIIDFVEITLSKNPLAGSIFEENLLFSKLVFEGNSIFYCENPIDKNLYIVYVQGRNTRFRPERMVDEEVA